MVPAHPLAALIEYVPFERLFTLFSLQTTFESVRLLASTKGYNYDKGLGVLVATMKDLH